MMQDELATPHNIFKSIVDDSDHGIIVLSSDLRIIMWNNWVDKYTRVGTKGALGQKIDEIFKHFIRTGVIGAIRSVVSSGRPIVLSEHFYPNPFPLFKPSGLGEPIYQKVHIRRKTNDDGTYHCVIEISDSSAKVQRERFLTRTKIYLDNVISAVQDMLIVIDSSVTVRSANSVFCKLVGVDEDEVQGMNLKDFFFYESEFDTFSVSLAISEFSLRDLELSLKSTNDKEIAVLLTYSQLNSPDEEALYVVTCKDISERKKTERLISFQRSQLELASKLSSLGEMAGGIAHEINNPLAIIGGSSRRLGGMLNLKDNKKSDKIKKYLKSIANATLRISKIVQGMKDISRNDRFNEFHTRKLSDIFESVNVLCLEKLANQGIEMNYLPNELDIELECNPMQISQVLLNLISNAADAIVRQEVKWIHISFVVDSNYVRISVTDSGNGIPQKIRDKIFDPFFTTKEVGKGIGLGLGISKSIVEAHGGTIFVDDSSENTKISFRLPLRQSQVEIKSGDFK